LIVDTPPEIGFDTQGKIKVFLGGGITGCPDWQRELIDKINMSEVHIYNPRWDYKWTGYQQIEWEYNKLKQSDIIVIWFAKGGQNRIVFYELGKWVNSSNITAFVGCDPEFDRKDDVVIQTKLARPDLTVYTSIGDIAYAIKKEVFKRTK